MSNERPNEFLSWRTSLSRQDVLPEHGLDDREGSWEKLAERLREKPRRRFTGYWLAAACLLLVLIPAARLFHDRSDASGKSPRRQIAIPEKVAVLPPVPVSRARTSPTQTPVSHDSASPVPAGTDPHSIALASPRLHGNSFRPRNAPTNGQGLPLMTTIAIVPASIAPVALASDTIPRGITTGANPLTQTPLPKKQLKIVYLNELNHGASATPAVATRGPSFLRVGFRKSGDIYSAEPDSRQKEPSSLTITITTQNH